MGIILPWYVPIKLGLLSIMDGADVIAHSRRSRAKSMRQNLSIKKSISRGRATGNELSKGQNIYSMVARREDKPF